MSLPCLRQTAAGVEVFLYVQPRASRNRLVGLIGEELKLALTSPPVDGAANKSCVEFFAKLSGRPKGSVKLVSGETSRHKRLLLEGADLDEMVALIGEALGA